MDEDIKEKLISKIKKECKDRYHSQAQWLNERVASIAKHTIEEYNGDIIEIGAGIGHTTERLLQLGRIVIVIDPFEKGYDYYPEGTNNHKKIRDDGYIYPFEEFQQNCEGYVNLVIIKECSQHVKYISNANFNIEIAFAFVDGLQITVENVYSDLVLMESVGTKVIAVDDYLSKFPDRALIIQNAVDKFVKKYDYDHVNTHEEYPEVRECYLIRNDK